MSAALSSTERTDDSFTSKWERWARDTLGVEGLSKRPKQGGARGVLVVGNKEGPCPSARLQGRQGGSGRMGCNGRMGCCGRKGKV